MPKRFKSLRGQLLLDGGGLRGSFFHRTVVLVCQHDAQGAFGLVLNKPTERFLGELISESVPEVIERQTLYLGGPVQPSTLSFIHSKPPIRGGNVLKNLSLGHSLEDLAALGNETKDGKLKVRVFAGYSGWGAGQLDEEMRREAWIPHPATVESVFDPVPGELWRRILRLKGWPYVLIGDAPEDFQLN